MSAVRGHHGRMPTLPLPRRYARRATRGPGCYWIDRPDPRPLRTRVERGFYLTDPDDPDDE